MSLKEHSISKSVFRELRMVFIHTNCLWLNKLNQMIWCSYTNLQSRYAATHILKSDLYTRWNNKGPVSVMYITNLPKAYTNTRITTWKEPYFQFCGISNKNHVVFCINFICFKNKVLITQISSQISEKWQMKFSINFFVWPWRFLKSNFQLHSNCKWST